MAKSKKYLFKRNLCYPVPSCVLHDLQKILILSVLGLLSDFSNVSSVGGDIYLKVQEIRQERQKARHHTHVTAVNEQRLPVLSVSGTMEWYLMRLMQILVVRYLNTDEVMLYCSLKSHLCLIKNSLLAHKPCILLCQSLSIIKNSVLAHKACIPLCQSSFMFKNSLLKPPDIVNSIGQSSFPIKNWICKPIDLDQEHPDIQIHTLIHNRNVDSVLDQKRHDFKALLQ